MTSVVGAKLRNLIGNHKWNRLKTSATKIKILCIKTESMHRHRINGVNTVENEFPKPDQVKTCKKWAICKVVEIEKQQSE